MTDLKAAGLYRRRRVIESVQGIYVQVEGKTLVNFCSNDYLALARHPDVIHAFKKAANEYGVGSGAAHLVCGHSYEHHALEAELSEFTGRKRVLLFSTGYMANLGVMTALLSKKSIAYEDKLNHASLLDGALLSGATLKRYLHSDTNSLQLKMTKDNHAEKMIITDGVFSMGGDIAALPGLVDVAQQQNACLLVDDAHGFGVLGKTGAGVLEHFNLTQEQVPLLMGTLGKALGTSGAFIAASDAVIEMLIQKARTYIYTTAMPPAIAAATRKSVQLIQKDVARREFLHDLIQRFKLGASELEIPLMASDTAIQPILIGDTKKTLAVSEALFTMGFWITAIRPPTVSQGSARLRVTLSAEHQYQDIDRLLVALHKALR